MCGESDITAEHMDPMTPDEFVEAIRAGDLVTAMRAAYETFNERGLDVSVCHAEAEWHQRPQLPDAGSYRGREEIARFNAEFIGSFDAFRADPLEIFESGGKVVAVVRVSGRVKGSDQRVEMEEVHVFSFRDGMIREIREYLTKSEALDALGLEGDVAAER
jgi:ketosteroid isomerase-like protein